MDLLQTILRTCDAETYTDNFRKNGIDSFTLKVLNEEDLKIIGIDDANLRQKLLKYISNFQIPTEKKTEVKVDAPYTLLVLNQISVQIHKHFVSLSYILKREDIDICDVKLESAVNSLQNCLTSLEGELIHFEKQIFGVKKSKRWKKKNILFPTIIATAVVLFLCKKYVTYFK